MLWAVDHLSHHAARRIGGGHEHGVEPELAGGNGLKVPKSTLDEVSDPVSATPSHPSMVPKNGYRNPVCAKARPPEWHPLRCSGLGSPAPASKENGEQRGAGPPQGADPRQPELAE
jgi:hypothetical protein